MSAQKGPSEQVCCISLNRSDRLRLLGCSPHLYPELRQAINQSWGSTSGGAIQSESTYYGCHEFKLTGNPWQGQGTESVPARRLLTSILSAMAKNGWNLIQCVGISKKATSKDSLFFERGKPDPNVTMFAMSFNKEDRIRLIDGPAFMPYLKQAVETSWSRGIQHEQEYRGSLELKLSGTPWKCGESQTVESRMLLAQILSNFRAAGYKLYASADISQGPKESPHQHIGHLDSWVFRKVNENWQ